MTKEISFLKLQIIKEENDRESKFEITAYNYMLQQLKNNYIDQYFMDRTL